MKNEWSASKHNVTLAHPLLSSFSDPFELEIEDIYHHKNKSSLSNPRSKEILSAVYLGTIIKLYLILVKKKSTACIVYYSVTDAIFQALSHPVTLSRVFDMR